MGGADSHEGWKEQTGGRRGEEMDDRFSPVQQKFTETLARIRVERLAAHWSPGGRGSASTACSTSHGPAGSSDVQQPGTGSQPSSTLKRKKNISFPVFLQEEQSARRLWPANGLPVMRLEEKQAEKLGGCRRRSN